MRHGIQLELEINELNETEKAVLRSILNEYLKPQHPPAGKQTHMIRNVRIVKV